MRAASPCLRVLKHGSICLLAPNPTRRATASDGAQVGVHAERCVPVRPSPTPTPGPQPHFRANYTFNSCLFEENEASQYSNNPLAAVGGGRCTRGNERVFWFGKYVLYVGLGCVGAWEWGRVEPGSSWCTRACLMWDAGGGDRWAVAACKAAVQLMILLPNACAGGAYLLRATSVTSYNTSWLRNAAYTAAAEGWGAGEYGNRD